MSVEVVVTSVSFVRRIEGRHRFFAYLLGTIPQLCPEEVITCSCWMAVLFFVVRECLAGIASDFCGVMGFLASVRELSL